MADLRTRYLGLELQSPLVASSSPLTGSLDGLRRLEAAGAGAVVLPSLFEEDLAEDGRSPAPTPGRPARPGRLRRRSGRLPVAGRTGQGDPVDPGDRQPERRLARRLGPVRGAAGAGRGRCPGAEHLLRASRPGADRRRGRGELPGRRPRRSAGASGSRWRSSSARYFSSLANMAGQLVEAGANGLVLFNRFYQPDLDIETLEVVPALDAQHLGRAAPAAALDRHPAPALGGCRWPPRPASTPPRTCSRC